MAQGTEYKLIAGLQWKWKQAAHRRTEGASKAKEGTGGCENGTGYLKKGREHLLRERPEILGFIKDHQREFPVEKMCRILKVSKSRYYQMKNYVSSKRDGENRMLLSEIRRIHEQSKASYGSPRMTEELRRRGFDASRPRVARLMKKSGIKAVHAKKFVVTTDSKHKYPVVENKLNRNFSAQTAGKHGCLILPISER